MKRIFVDTNILLDAVLQRGHTDEALRLLQWCDGGLIHLCASSLSYANIAYILRKRPQEERYQYLRMLRQGIEVISLDAACLDRALRHQVNDFEDMLQYQCAVAGGCEAIVTNNIKDFREFSEMPVFSSAEMVGRLTSDFARKRGREE